MTEKWFSNSRNSKLKLTRRHGPTRLVAAPAWAVAADYGRVLPCEGNTRFFFLDIIHCEFLNWLGSTLS